jgi:LmbE family N-acetylglucosaminyl deacetylase
VTTAHRTLKAIRALVPATVEEILDGGTPVVLAPHPDDEVIGCGALLAAAVRSGVTPSIVFITDGSGSHPRSRAFPRDVLVALRQHEACTAAEILGIGLTRVHFMGLRDTAAPHGGSAFAGAVERIVDIARLREKPVILAPWSYDPHGDHLAVAKMAARAAMVMGVRHLSYVVWGWTLPHDQELGDLRVEGWRLRMRNIDHDQKWRAMNAYKSQTTNLIDDDPTGFRFDPDTLRTMLAEEEVFLINP